MENSKRSYVRPKLTRYGKVAEITKSSLSLGGGDYLCHHLACDPNSPLQPVPCGS